MEDVQQNMNQQQKSPGCLGFVIGGMSFIPLIGVFFGIVAIVWGFAIKSTKLKIVGFAGILFTVVVYGALGYFGFVEKGGVYDDLRTSLAKSTLSSAVQAIEFYKVQHGHYPASLETLENSLPENSMVFLQDPSLVESSDSKYFYYVLINENEYHIRAYGRDGILNTNDDVLPEPIEKIGLVVNYTPVSN
ncbi:type II secretion system protein GspG [Motilimonas sp. 1_MG-2023]|uniref:type II secretion system protein GspG n=1 Tax=Motilimonas sp. 1_MG-2023 TaxID=3062672 RepID=UPI0026E2489C|nr:type II secretion system protein GspG [Motilimonas sp. 1_MG-2023]MDO6525750.1 type II secretion system protein GspG [Motilimonas sp. 1_MG-2023]